MAHEVAGDSGTTLQLDVLDDFEALQGLADEWRELAARAEGYGVAQSLLWARAGWLTRRAPGREVRCVTVRSDGELVCIWPWLRVRQGRVRLLEPLGSGGHEEYAAPLIADGTQVDRVLRLALEAVAADADVVRFSNVWAGSELDRLVRRTGLVRAAKGTPSPLIRFGGFATWKDYQASRPRKLISDLRRQNRRLAELGRPEIVSAQSNDQILSGVDWLLAHKRAWLDVKGIRGAWLWTDQSREFLAATLIAGLEHGDVRLFLLNLDGRTIAAAYCLVDSRRFEFFIVANDPAFENLSPGKILVEFIARWAFERGLEFDFRMVATDYKLRWANAEAVSTTWFVALTPAGLPTVAWIAVRHAAGAARRGLASRVGRGRIQAIKRRLGLTHSG